MSTIKEEDSKHVTRDMGTYVLGMRNDAEADLTDADLDYSGVAVDAKGRLKVVTAAGVPVTTGDNKAEDAAHVSGDTGSFALSLRTDVAASSAGTTGDYAALNTDASGRLWTHAENPTAANFLVTATDAKVEDVAHTGGDTGSFILAVRNDGMVARTSTTGDYSPVSVDSIGKILTGDNRFEDTVHTDGDIGSFILGVRNDALAVLAAEGDYIPIATDFAGRLRTADQKAEDAAHGDGDIGSFALSVRTDVAASSAGATGDYASLNTDATGRLWVHAENPTAANFLVTATDAKAEDAGHVTADVGSFVLGVRNDELSVTPTVPTNVTTAAVDYSQVSVDNAGRVYTRLPVDWTQKDEPAADTVASAVRAAGAANVRHVCTSILASITGVPAALTPVTVRLLDGATIIYAARMAVIAASPTQSIELAGLNIIGSAATSMTLQVSDPAEAATTVTASFSGYDVI